MANIVMTNIVKYGIMNFVELTNYGEGGLIWIPELKLKTQEEL